MIANQKEWLDVCETWHIGKDLLCRIGSHSIVDGFHALPIEKSTDGESCRRVLQSLVKLDDLVGLQPKLPELLHHKWHVVVKEVLKIKFAVLRIFVQNDSA